MNTECSETEHHYFTEARSWADDMYTTAVSQRNRWRAACLYACLPLILLFCYWVSLLLPSQHIEPFLVHHYDSGYISVEPMKNDEIKTSWPQTTSNLVKYLNNLLTYHEVSYKEQYENVILLSSHDVAKQYIQEQSAKNPDSPVNVLGSKFNRKIHIQTIIPLDSDETPHNQSGEIHKNLAKVDFTLTDIEKRTGKQKTIAKSALISWEYRLRSHDPKQAWKNWDGFTVTSYSLHDRHL